MASTTTTTWVNGRPARGVRPMLSRQYVGFHQPAALGGSWLATPTTDVTMIINTGRPFGGLPQAFVAGLTQTSGVIDMTGEVECLELKLSPLGAYTLLGIPSHELTGQVVDLGDLLGRQGDRLIDRLTETAAWDRRFGPVDEFLARRAERGRQPAAEIDWAWQRLTAAAGLVPIGTLATEVGWSRRHLVAKFREQVGLTPKTVARLLRFERLLRRLRNPGGAGWAQLALECGYYDQAHMNRDFRDFAGTTPTAYLARAGVQVTSVQYPWVPAA